MMDVIEPPFLNVRVRFRRQLRIVRHPAELAPATHCRDCHLVVFFPFEIGGVQAVRPVQKVKVIGQRFRRLEIRGADERSCRSESAVFDGRAEDDGYGVV